MRTADSEGIKYLATALNNIGVACIVTGGIGPVIGVAIGSIHAENAAALTVLCLSFTLLGIVFILAAQRVLRFLK